MLRIITARVITLLAMNTETKTINSPGLLSNKGLIPPPQPIAGLKPGASLPELYTYQDYRKFLKDWLQHRKQIQSEYSGALFAKKAGFQSHTLLGMVIRGERNLSYTAIRSFAKALNLKAREKIYFEKLVLFNQSKNSQEKADFFEELVSLSQSAGKNLLTQLKDYAKCISHWYVTAVHELVLLPDFKADPSWMSKKLKGKISKKEAGEAWDILLNLGLVKLNPATNHFEQAHPAMDFDPGMVDFAIRNFHKEFLERAKSAIDQESLAERELSSLTLAVSEEDLPDLREKIKEFRKQLNLIYSKGSESKKAKHVISLNMQLLVLTEGLGAGSSNTIKTQEKSGEEK